MVLKVFAFGIKNYVRDEYNLFDGILVGISLVDFTIESVSVSSKSSNLSVITAFRTFRLLRIFKLASKSEGLLVLL